MPRGQRRGVTDRVGICMGERNQPIHLQCARANRTNTLGERSSNLSDATQEPLLELALQRSHCAISWLVSCLWRLCHSHTSSYFALSRAKAQH
jgi:hypothetical protein